MSQRLTLVVLPIASQLQSGRTATQSTFVVPIYERFADRPTETPLPDPSRAVPDGLNERS
jgi:hypothetical protein